MYCSLVYSVVQLSSCVVLYNVLYCKVQYKYLTLIKPTYGSVLCQASLVDLTEMAEQPTFLIVIERTDHMYTLHRCGRRSDELFHLHSKRSSFL